MSSKRDHGDMDDGEIIEPEQKRPKKHNPKSRQQHPSGTDPTWGQKYVFSNLEHATTIPAGEESEFEDDADAMAYLLSVRKEAVGIPHLLVAPKVQIGPQIPSELQGSNDDDGDDDDGMEDGEVDRGIYENGVGDSRGWYEDGAYVGRPEEEQENDDEEDACLEEEEEASEKAINEAYYASLLSQYSRLRRLLESVPSSKSSESLPPYRPTYAAPFGPHSHTMAQWSKAIRDTDPHPLQVSRLSKDSILRILRVLLGGKFLRRGYPLPERTSRWLWVLLARLPDRGELNHLEIGWIRDLGRRAVLLGRSLAEMAVLREELEDGGLGVNEGVDASSSDEDVLADADDVEVEGADSSGESAEPDKEEEQPVPEPEAPDARNDDDDAEEGEVEEDEDVAMDIESESDQGEGQAADEDKQARLQDAKARLLAQLDEDAPSEAELAQEAAEQRLRMNMRATLSMILTVAGEFYGQRDLLEFREPFVGM
ncbi:hypothetical protein B0I35DRAFT_433850 [Stachybotrys elegans]|uniref:V-snare n=1 Tax=Stachybotrys elegans TaxID=80388 RepID=A0A8K0ST72_9HYPO|nr:hypothetical protein B0I35DRAFT_433850 [Stachybotrys elegans]